jgi:hypothetical protein
MENKDDDDDDDKLFRWPLEHFVAGTICDITFGTLCGWHNM